jgi:hypothetical protein
MMDKESKEFFEKEGFRVNDENFPKDKMIMYFPNEGHYVEILGHKLEVDGNGCGEFCEYIKRLATYEEENKRLNEYIDFYKDVNENAVKIISDLKNSVKYYVDILTDLKKWLEDTETKPQYIASNHYFDSCVLEKIKELENEYGNVK